MPKTLRTHRDDDSPEDEQDKFDHDLVKKHVTQLIEHFDSVRITVTRHDAQSGQSRTFSTGDGNFYAQWAATREWMMHQDERAKKEVWNED